MSGSKVTVKVESVLDGNTLRVIFPHEDTGESLRILCLDCENSQIGVNAETPMGHKATARAKELLHPGDKIMLKLQGREPLEVALEKYRGNHGRLLCYVRLEDGRDFQEIMIEEGLSPYFTKYGYADFTTFHNRYVSAERRAQAARRGIWNQIGNNGVEMRNYARLKSWWELRARIIENYRQIKISAPEISLYNTRRDYDYLVALARARGETTVFIELYDFYPAGDHIVFKSGSRAQPFKIFVPGGNAGQADDVIGLLTTRYIAQNEITPRRSYAFITGPVRMYPDDRGAPEMVLTTVDQVTDWPGVAIERGVSMLARPAE